MVSLEPYRDCVSQVGGDLVITATKVPDKLSS